MIRSGKKTIETRTWNTRIRERILLCASKKPESEISGKAFATAILADTRMMWYDDQKAACCDFNPKAYSWFLEEIEPIIVPFPVKGQLGFFEAPVF